ncbi:MAG: ABC transporter permease [Acidimicrobiales bacterium]
MNLPVSRQVMYALAAPAAAVIFAVTLSSLVLIISGSNPVTAYGDMIESGTQLESIVDMFNRAVPLYLAGVAVAIGFKMNLFNIGVEGQYILAAFFGAAAGGAVDLPPFLHVVFIMVVSISVGAAWAGLAGLLKVHRGINEVISTIMLNFIAIGGLVAWLSVEWRDGDIATSSGTALIDDTGHMPNINWILEIFSRDIRAPRELSGMVFIAIAVGVLYHLFINRTRMGFDLRASGLNPLAARAGGVPPARMIMMAMLLGGAVAGLVGMVDILSKAHRYDVNFTQAIGFNGIAVALLGRNNPVGIAVGALLWAFMDTASSVLQITGSATPEIVDIMKGIILLTAVISYEAVGRIRRREEAAAAAAVLQKRSEDKSTEEAAA